MFYVVEVDNDGFKVYDSSGTLIDPAKEGTLNDVKTILTAIRDTAGIKKITDALPTGDNWIGRIKLGDGTNLIAIPTDGDALTGYGIPILGRDAEDKARFLFTEEDGTLRVASQPPSPPPGTIPFVLAQDDANLEVGPVPSYHDTESAVIANNVNLYIQTFVAGAAGDPSEKGSKVELYWREGAGPTDHLIARIYLTGQTVLETLPDVNESRDGTHLTGNGTNTKLVLRRERLSTSAAEIDGEVRGYTV
jgi:hypothetical protein